MFVRTKRGADRLVTQLEREGVRALAIHGDLRQGARERALADFIAGKVPVLVATDVAARGIHVDAVDVVVHYDPAEDHKAYLHRSGRTARAGESGVAVTLQLWNQENDIRVIQRRLGLQIPVVEVFSNDPRLADLANWDAAPPSWRRSAPNHVGRGRPACHHGRMSRVSRRVGAIAESATLAVDAKAKALQAAGDDVIGFGAGEPDFPTPAAHRRGGGRGVRGPGDHHYTPAAGLPELRAAIAAKTARDSGYVVEPQPGASSPTAASTRSTTRSRRCSTRATRCSLPAPYWTTYPEAIALADGVPVVAAHHRAGTGSASPSSSSRRRGRRAPRRCCSCRRATPPARCTRRTRSRRSAAGPSSTASG